MEAGAGFLEMLNETAYWGTLKAHLTFAVISAAAWYVLYLTATT